MIDDRKGSRWIYFLAIDVVTDTCLMWLPGQEHVIKQGACNVIDRPQGKCDQWYGQLIAPITLFYSLREALLGWMFDINVAFTFYFVLGRYMRFSWLKQCWNTFVTKTDAGLSYQEIRLWKAKAHNVLNFCAELQCTFKDRLHCDQLQSPYRQNLCLCHETHVRNSCYEPNALVEAYTPGLDPSFDKWQHQYRGKYDRYDKS